LQDHNGVVIAFFRPTRQTRYQIGDVFGELHFVRTAGAGTVVRILTPVILSIFLMFFSALSFKMHPPIMDTVTVTAMLYRFCAQWNL
jgi:hypothetical protein